MTHPSLPALAVCCALLTACATPTDRPAAESAPFDAAQPEASDEQVTATFDWLTERARIIAALEDSGEIDAHSRDDGSLLLRLPAAEGFAGDSIEPSASLRTSLDRVADALSLDTETEVKVLGHTDSLGSELYNLALSIRRAEAVMEYLRTRGVALGRLLADGRGEAEPIADNHTPEGRALNRRVEIVVRPF